MDNIFNTKLFTPMNVLAIGAVIFFWACVAYTLNDVITQQT